MGVDFFPCDHCGTSICDCGTYYYCRDICERRWCSRECATAEGYSPIIPYADDPNDFSCKYCRNEEAEDVDLFKFLLKKFNLERTEVLKMYLENENPNN